MTITMVSIKKDLDLNSVKSCAFHHSQWESCETNEHVSIPYLIYRFLFMIILVSSITFSTLCQSHLFHIFLTNWSFTLQTLYGILFCFNIVWRKHEFILQTIRRKFRHHQHHDTECNGKNYELKETTTCYDNMADVTVHEALNNKNKTANGTGNGVVTKDDNDGDDDEQPQINSATAMTTDSPVKKSDTSVIVKNNNNIQAKYEDPPTPLEKLIWILMNVSHVLPHVVAFGYWVFVYKYDPDQAPCERFRSHYIVHGALSVLALIDSLVVAVPARITHSVFPTAILFVYSLFSYLYEIFGGEYRNGKEFIYSILNWRYKPNRTTGLVVAGVVLSPLIHMITCWGVHHIKLKLVNHSKRYRK